MRRHLLLCVASSRRPGLDAPVGSAEVIVLSSAQRIAKTEIIAAYSTQASALGLTAAALARDPAKLDYGLCWRLSIAAVSAEPRETPICEAT